MFNPAIPPKLPPSWSGRRDALKFLHPDYSTRVKFYVRFLVPTGHALFMIERDIWIFSEEFHSAIMKEEELQYLKAFFKITQ